MTDDIKTNAVRRAVALLTAAGAQYKVIHGDLEFGELRIAPPDPAAHAPQGQY